MHLCIKIIPCSVSQGREDLWSLEGAHTLAEGPGILVSAAENEAQPPLLRKPDQSQGEKKQQLDISCFFVVVGSKFVLKNKRMFKCMEAFIKSSCRQQTRFFLSHRIILLGKKNNIYIYIYKFISIHWLTL